MPHTRRSNLVFTDAFEPVSLDRVMSGPASRHTAVWVLLAGLILRAATPAGYMVGVSLPGTNSHNHHHHSAEDDSQSEPDRCQMGHLLSSVVAVDDALAEESLRFEAADITIPPPAAKPSASLSAYRSRGPPA
jgi:hypothetical protein